METYTAFEAIDEIRTGRNFMICEGVWLEDGRAGIQVKAKGRNETKHDQTSFYAFAKSYCDSMLPSAPNPQEKACLLMMKQTAEKALKQGRLN